MLLRELEPEVMDTAAEAQAYDAMDHAEPNRNFVARLEELGAHGHMLDIGTGPGDIPILAAEKFPTARIVGVDLSQPMLDIALAKAHRMNLAARLDFRSADAKWLEFPTHSFDTVFSNTILHHLPDPQPFLAEAWRVRKPGGVFLIRDLFRPDSKQEVETLVKRHCGSATPGQKQLFRQSLLAALTPAELEAVAQVAGLPIGKELQVVIDTDRHMSLQTMARK